MQAFEALFAKYFQRVYRFALSLTRDAHAAEELTQQTFFKALRGIHGFEGRSDPATWLCSIAKHEFYDHARKDRERAVEPNSPLLAREGESPEALALRRDQAMRLHERLHALAEPYREVFTLRVFGELRFAQIAALFGRTESWARVTFYRAKRSLQDEIGEDDYER